MRNISKYLRTKGLINIPIMLEFIDNKKMDIFLNSIKNETGIDLTNETVATLTDDEVNKLKSFELNKLGFYLETILKEKNIEIDEKDRQLDVEISSNNNKTKIGMVYLFWYGVIITIFSFVYIAIVTFIPIPPENVRVVDTTIGILLGSVFSTVVNFFFGNSAQSVNGQEQKTKNKSK